MREVRSLVDSGMMGDISGMYPSITSIRKQKTGGIRVPIQSVKLQNALLSMREVHILYRAT